MDKVKIRKIGNSLGVTLPAELLKQLRLNEGDEMHVTVGPDGLNFVPFNDEFERQMAIAEDFMHRYRNTLRELAK